MVFSKFSDQIVISFLVLLSFATKFPFRHPWLEDWDSVQFALALTDYSVVNHQPHPPGYPLFILIARFFNLFIQNDTLTLTTLSALFATLSIVPLFLLAKKLFNFQAAIISCLIFIVTPVGWVMSEVATTNMTGLFFEITLAYLAVKFLKNPTKALPLGFFAGFILGIRPTDLPVVISILAFLTINNLNPRYIFFLFISFIGSIMLWLIPLIYITGVGEFIEAYSKVADYIIWHDTLTGQQLTVKSYIRVRLSGFLLLIEQGFTTILALITFILLTHLTLRKARSVFTTPKYQLIYFWVVGYAMLLLFFYNLELPQYTLPLLPPVALIIGYSASLLKNQLIKIVIIFILLIQLISISLPQVISQSKDIPPSIEPVLYIKQNLDPLKTTLITTYIYRQVQYYIPEYKNYYGVNNVRENIESKYIVTDYEDIKNHLPFFNEYILADTKSYSKPKLPFPRLHNTHIYIFIRKEM